MRKFALMQSGCQEVKHGTYILHGTQEQIILCRCNFITILPVSVLSPDHTYSVFIRAMFVQLHELAFAYYKFYGEYFDNNSSENVFKCYELTKHRLRPPQDLHVQLRMCQPDPSVITSHLESHVFLHED